MSERSYVACDRGGPDGDYSCYVECRRCDDGSIEIVRTLYVPPARPSGVQGPKS